jgi:hypothetical protein
MLDSVQRDLAVYLIRKNARMMSGKPVVPLRLINSVLLAQSACLPDSLLLPFASGLGRLLDRIRFDQTALSPGMASLLSKNRRCAVDNLKSMRTFAGRLRWQFGVSPRRAVLAGEGAALTALYHDPGAFPGTSWTALLPDGTLTDGNAPDCAKVRRLEPPEMDWSEEAEIGGIIWRRPKPEFLLALLAGHVGDPTTPLDPPVWAHLGLALQVWAEAVAVTDVLEIGRRLGQPDEVERGLMVTGRIFPELGRWLAPAPQHIPGWERRFAVPLAARRLVQGNRE